MKQQITLTLMSHHFKKTEQGEKDKQQKANIITGTAHSI